MDEVNAERTEFDECDVFYDRPDKHQQNTKIII